MAKLVGVIRSDEYNFERRQLPLHCDDNLTMIVQFEDTCLGCTKEGMKQKELEPFVQRFHNLSNDDISVALMVTSREVFSLLSQMVPCVGCRRSVERLFGQLVESGHPVLEPLIIAPNSVLSIKREYLFDPKALFALFYIHGSKLSSVVESIPKSKKNKRCALHSLDSHTHKTRTLGTWMEIWELLSTECREEVVLIECDAFMETLENYLRKHRFCTECKSKVLRAYNILIGEVESKAEKGYVAALYEGLRCCQKHIHVLSDTDFISHLITRAEPDLMGSRRERHAKTLDIAQEEVLTCLGIHLYERLHKIWQKLRAEEQTWQILFYLGVDALRKNFEVAQENKQGISNLELVCEELLQEEQAKEQRRVQKRDKKKKKKKNKKTTVSNGNGNREKDSTMNVDIEVEKENCSCDENTNLKTQICNSCDDNHHKSNNKVTCGGIIGNHGGREFGGGGGGCVHKPPMSPLVPCRSSCNRSDCGYSSGQEGCDNCSIPSSRDGSDVACSEGICNHDGDSVLCHKDDLVEAVMSCQNCNASGSPNVSPQHKTSHDTWSAKCWGSNNHRKNDSHIHSGSRGVHHTQQHNSSADHGLTLSLQDMLEDSCSGSEDDAQIPKISEEEIQRFKANQTHVNNQRCQLRAMLRQRFANLQMKPPMSNLCGTSCEK